MAFRSLALLALAFCAVDAQTAPAPVAEEKVSVTTNKGNSLKAVDGPNFIGQRFGCLDNTISTTPPYLERADIQYFEVDHEKYDHITLTPAFKEDGSECATTFMIAVFSCLADRDCMVRSGVADMHRLLASEGWQSYSASMRFKVCENCSFNQNTRMYTKTVYETDAPIVLPTSMYMGVFATSSCGTVVEAKNVPTNIGPVNYLCGVYCPEMPGFFS